MGFIGLYIYRLGFKGLKKWKHFHPLKQLQRLYVKLATIPFGIIFKLIWMENSHKKEDE